MRVTGCALKGSGIRLIRSPRWRTNVGSSEDDHQILLPIDQEVRIWSLLLIHGLEPRLKED
jgi:hypothetical protein